MSAPRQAIGIRRLEPADCTILIDGIETPARSGEPVAAALLGRGEWDRLYCGMGVCFACAVTIDGRRGQRACMEPVVPGMSVELTEPDGTRSGPEDGS